MFDSSGCPKSPATDGPPPAIAMYCMSPTLKEMAGAGNLHLAAVADRLSASIARFKEATQWIVENYATNPAAVAAGSVYYLKLTGITLGGWMLARSAQIASRQLEAGGGDKDFLRGKLLTARFYADHILPQAMALCAAAMRGADSVLAVEEALL